jgi:DNA modification methylase
MNYTKFLEKKKKVKTDSGFTPNLLNENLYEFQKYIVNRACQAGKFAIFADTGLGKTLMQLEWAKQVRDRVQKSILIVAPLAVRQQTVEEGERFGYKVHKFEENYLLYNDSFEDEFKNRIYITNYENLHNVNAELFDGVILDESSILKNSEGFNRNELIKKFKNTPYKLCCTATPSPNDPMELGNHSEFLDVMGYNEMLSMYFIHDGGNTSKWRLKKHAKDDFYEFVSSWAVMLKLPSDLGYDDNGFILPGLNMEEIIIQTTVQDGMLFNHSAVNSTDFGKSLRETEYDRLNKVIKIVQRLNGEQIIIWAKQNIESDRLQKMLNDKGYDCRNVKGSDSQEKKENDLIGFANNDYQILITKSKIAQYGLNYQNCHNQIFTAVDFSFEATYQSIRRSYRFGQHHVVNAWLITTDRMTNVLQLFKKKQKQFEEMRSRMTKAINKHTKVEITDNSTDEETIKAKNYTLMKGDNVKRIKEIEDNSVDLFITSTPFAELYTYSSYIQDMGNAKDYDEFFSHLDFLLPDLKRVMTPGRIVAFHCMDLPVQKGKEGYIGLRDFSGSLIQRMTDNGFIYHSRITIWKNPVTEMTRTKALGLLHKQIKKDSAMCRVGIPDYILVFRVPGENPKPIINQDKDSQKENYIPVDMWQKIASPVWYDIDYSKTLNYREAKTNEDEKHICPLQLDTIERLLLLYSNEGDTVGDFFGGIMSVGFESIKKKRKFIGMELKDSYFNLGKIKMKMSEIEKRQQKLF